ncbi:PaaI family thioesterase [Sphingobium boeckii]|uniref:Uncharacterized protein (TIGR00369 family) n=1 Tax=Sphingobium boeckii TaxID=1082345 RepID=A0A7W9EFV2_9SPHN|nr:PaaI family thioesterase [Sphingobium boeckii]MBB5687499.1 uncharacterized protein (TIGR00369 family) [Sphingobium boeckii]
MTAPALSAAQRERIMASFARQGFLRGMGARIVDLETGRCAIELPFGDAVSQQHGFFHGGAIGALADTAGGYAAMTMVRDDQEVVTLEYKINFLRPAVGDHLIAQGDVLRAGRSVIVVRVDVYAVDGGRQVLCAALQQSIAPVPATGP